MWNGRGFGTRCVKIMVIDVGFRNSFSLRLELSLFWEANEWEGVESMVVMIYTRNSRTGLWGVMFTVILCPPA